MEQPEKITKKTKHGYSNIQGLSIRWGGSSESNNFEVVHFMNKAKQPGKKDKPNSSLHKTQAKKQGKKDKPQTRKHKKKKTRKEEVKERRKERERERERPAKKIER